MWQDLELLTCIKWSVLQATQLGEESDALAVNDVTGLCVKCGLLVGSVVEVAELLREVGRVSAACACKLMNSNNSL